MFRVYLLWLLLWSALKSSSLAKNHSHVKKHYDINSDELFLKELIELKTRHGTDGLMSKIFPSKDFDGRNLNEQEEVKESFNPLHMPPADLLDVVFIFDSKDRSAIKPSIVFESWKQVVMGFNCIIIGDESIVENLVIPEWMLAKYEVYSRQGLIQTILDSGMAKSKILSDTAYVLKEVFHEEIPNVSHVYDFIDTYSLAGWVSDKEMIYVVSNEFTPCTDDSKTHCSEAEGVLDAHIHNLQMPSLPYYYHGLSEQSSSFPRSYPYPLRGGVTSVVSHGLALDEESNYDEVTKLLRRKSKADHRHHHDHYHQQQSLDHLEPETIPYGQLFSLNRNNVAFNRKLMGSTMMLFGSGSTVIQNQHLLPFYNYYDVLSGWIAKIVADQCGFGVKFGAPLISRSLNGTDKASSDAKKLKAMFHDVNSNFTFLRDERIYQYFAQWRLNTTSPSFKGNKLCGGKMMRSECIYSVFAKDLEVSSLSEEYPFFGLLSLYMKLWLNTWELRHAFLGTTFPKALRGSFSPTQNSTSHRCAVITITHNEPQLLPVWIRYHLRHFNPGDIFVLDHITDDNSTDPSKIPKGIHLSKLEGNKYHMPVQFRSKVIQTYQDRLLRGGYACVLFSDTDEIVVPNPIKYPKGLHQYLEKFTANPKAQSMRVTAIELGHMSYGNGKPSSQEKPLNWNESILAQRSFFAWDRVYNKPLLTKVPLAYRPGFHRLYNYKLDRTVETDPELVMFHLRSMDADFCLHREIVKYNMTKKMEPAELNAGYASHWNTYEKDKKTGELCKYAIGCYLGEFQENVTKLWDNTGVHPMYKLEDYWKTVDL